MANQHGSETECPKSGDISSDFADIMVRSHSLISDFITRQMNNGEVDPGKSADSGIAMANTFLEITTRMMADPAKVMRAQMSLWNDYVEILKNATGGGEKPVITPDKGDKRFKDPEWSENEIFSFIKQSYLLTSRWMQSTIREIDGLDDKTAEKANFYTRQFVNAMSPGNFVMTNPQVLRTTVETRGENLVRGLKNLLEDLERGKGKLAIRTNDTSAFTVGENIALTRGKVIFRNDMMELIQYSPGTETVRKRPLLIVPPWINKFYILDMREENSLIKWAVDQGNTVFVISWVNPGRELADKSFEDYMLEGPMAALDAIENATGEKRVNAVGYCIGGTLLAATLAYMAARKDNRIGSATFLTAMTDFHDPGELGVFIDEEQISKLEEKMNERGYLDDTEMADTFSMLRENDMIWSFVINNYLLGKEPLPFDLLYWNSDSTRMPAAMHSFYLRNMYMENKLVEPGGITLDGVPIDLSKIRIPTYILSTREDHIAPWKSTYAATRIYSGPVRFVLSASGHIAGVVNPPVKNKYCYWINDKKPQDPQDWLDGAKCHDGSWWNDWDKWLKKHVGGKNVPARIPGDGKLKAMEDAPGTYVKVRSDCAGTAS